MATSLMAKATNRRTRKAERTGILATVDAKTIFRMVLAMPKVIARDPVVHILIGLSIVTMWCVRNNDVDLLVRQSFSSCEFSPCSPRRSDRILVLQAAVMRVFSAFGKHPSRKLRVADS